MQVDYTGFTTINAQRFGQKFVGKVANPHDILLWHKAPVRKTKVSDGCSKCYLVAVAVVFRLCNRWGADMA